MKKVQIEEMKTTFAEMSSEELADALGELDSDMADMDIESSIIKGVILERGTTPVEGTLFRSVIVPGSEQLIFDKEAFIKEYNEEIYNRYLRRSTRSPHVRVFPKSGKDIL